MSFVAGMRGWDLMPWVLPVVTLAGQATMACNQPLIAKEEDPVAFALRECEGAGVDHVTVADEMASSCCCLPSGPAQACERSPSMQVMEASQPI